MKKVILNLAFALGVIGFLAFTSNHRDKLAVNPSASSVVWKGYKVTGQHAGTIGIKEGTLEMDHGTFVGGTFTIDMSTIKVTDLEGEYAEKLRGHLSSDDFFGVANYPTAKFEITKVVSRGTPGDYKVVGNMTIKEKTNEVKFNAQVNMKDGIATATADITIDRSEFDVRYGSASFVNNLKDKTIYDEFELSIKLVTGK